MAETAWLDCTNTTCSCKYDLRMDPSPVTEANHVSSASFVFPTGAPSKY